jgi:hypothetical protein
MKELPTASMMIRTTRKNKPTSQPESLRNRSITIQIKYSKTLAANTPRKMDKRVFFGENGDGPNRYPATKAAAKKANTK